MSNNYDEVYEQFKELCKELALNFNEEELDAVIVAFKGNPYFVSFLANILATGTMEVVFAQLRQGMDSKIAVAMMENYTSVGMVIAVTFYWLGEKHAFEKSKLRKGVNLN